MLFLIVAAALLLGRLSFAIAGWMIGRWDGVRAVRTGQDWARDHRRTR